MIGMNILEPKSNIHVAINIPCAIVALGVQHCISEIAERESLCLTVSHLEPPPLVTALPPGSIVILDISDYPAQVAEAMTLLHARQFMLPATSVIILTSNKNPRLLSYLSALDVRAIISCHESITIFRNLFIRSMVQGEETDLSPLIKMMIKEELPKKLTVREIQVLDKLFHGKSVSVIAEELGRDIRTISTHKRRAMEKLNLKNERDLHQLGCDLSGQ